MIKRIREAVETFHDIAKVYNFSYSVPKPIDGNKISELGYTLDYLSNTYGVKFVIAAGNHDLYKSHYSLEDILKDKDARLSIPADSMLNISVGSVVGGDCLGSLSMQGEVAPYSRIGPGLYGVRKPDLVAYSATKIRDGKSPINEYSLMLSSENNKVYDSGTSFTAPIVAGDLAQIIQSIPDKNVLMAETLLYHGASLPLQIDAKHKLQKDEVRYHGDLYGRGIPKPMISMYSQAHRVTFIHTGTLNRKTKRHIKFLVPKVFEEVKKKVKVIVTCVTQSPVDFERGEEYICAYVSASLHKLNTKGNSKVSNPQKTDGREKWNRCYHFEENYLSFKAGDWEVWLELFSRWDVENTQNINYALAVTVEDLSRSLNVYNEIVSEAKGRFPAMQSIRIPVR